MRKPAGEFYFKRYPKTTILFALFIIIVAIALIYPRRPAVYRPESFQIQLRVSYRRIGLV